MWKNKEETVAFFRKRENSACLPADLPPVQTKFLASWLPGGYNRMQHRVIDKGALP